MAEQSLVSYVRKRRADAGLSQSELAARVGVSRQALIAIEAGRQVPATGLALQLARELGCAVESLFALRAGAHLTAALAGPDVDGGRVSLSRVDGRWVAHAMSAADRPADGLLVGEARLGVAQVEPLCELEQLQDNVLVAGCAPLLGVLAERLGQRGRAARATWISQNSARSLELLEQGLVHIAGVHLAAAADPAVHAKAARSALPGQRLTLVNLARWRQGLVVARGNPQRVDTPPGGFAPGLRWVMREPGAGAQRLLERVLADAGQDLAAARGGPLASSHAEVARLVRWGVADVGVAIESAALAEGVDFIPLIEERFDLVVPQARLDTPHVAGFLDLIDRPLFRSEAARLPGYDLCQAGHASTVAPL